MTNDELAKRLEERANALEAWYSLLPESSGAEDKTDIVLMREAASALRSIAEGEKDDSDRMIERLDGIVMHLLAGSDESPAYKEGVVVFLREIRAALRRVSAPAVPEGWKIVPEKPTPEMLRAARKAQRETLIQHIKQYPPSWMKQEPDRISYAETEFATFEEAKEAQQCDLINVEYRAMLAAAPMPPDVPDGATGKEGEK